MNYIGSKNRLSEFILSNILERTQNPENQVFAEIFGGTGIIARQLKTQFKQIIANDLEDYSYALLRHYVGNHQVLDRLPSLIEELNTQSGQEGFIYRNYCLGSGSGRSYFSDANGKKIDAIRQKLQDWQSQKYINDNEFYALLASLLEAADKVANTASVYGAFLKQLKKSAQKPLQLCLAAYDTCPNAPQVFRKDANTLIKEISGDVLYLDPPYNARQYGANYHLLNTIALYDEFEPKGKTGLRDYQKSQYCQKGKVGEALDGLLKAAEFSWIFLSYNNEGLLSETEVRQIMQQYGHYTLVKQEYQRFKADKDQNRQHKAAKTYEYLHILKKS